MELPGNLERYLKSNILYNVKCTVYKNATPIQERTLNFGISIVFFVRKFPKDMAGYAIGNQIIRSGTSIGANVEESQNAQSRKDFIHGMTIALKEARETEYWLKILEQTKTFPANETVYLKNEVNELVKILTVIIKNSKQNAKSIQG